MAPRRLSYEKNLSPRARTHARAARGVDCNVHADYPHRSPDFVPILESAKNDLKWLFQTENMVLILASTGTGGMVGAVNNFLSPGDKAVVVRGGKFGERWTEICEAYGVLPINIDVEWGYAVKPEQVEAELKKDPSIKAVLIQASETSTGVAHPTKEIGEIVKKYPTAFSWWTRLRPWACSTCRWTNGASTSA